MQSLTSFASSYAVEQLGIQHERLRVLRCEKRRLTDPLDIEDQDEAIAHCEKWVKALQDQLESSHL